jgi:hypothetical protein
MLRRCGRVFWRKLALRSICDERLPDGSWRGVMRTLETLSDPRLLIVASHFADERLWAEVLNEGGFDVLAKPFVSTHRACAERETRRSKTQRRALTARPGFGRALLAETIAE